MPPAKKTKPEGSDAAPIWARPIERPLGNWDQLLLVALYMSTYLEYGPSAAHVSAQHKPKKHSISSQLKKKSAIAIITAQQQNSHLAAAKHTRFTH
jgi:hypothetical protein